MKRTLALVLSFIIAAGMVSCGKATEAGDSSSASSVSSKAEGSASMANKEEESSDAVSSEQEKESSSESEKEKEKDSSQAEKTDSSKAASDSSSKADSSAASTEVEYDYFTSTDKIENALLIKLRGLISAAADNDESKYLRIFDVNNYAEVFNYGGDTTASKERYKEKAIENFKALSKELNGKFSGKLTDFVVEDCENFYMDTNGEVCFIDFTAKEEEGDLHFFVTAYKNNGYWSVDLSMWTRIDNAYYDFEELIVNELKAAAAGDLKKYLECANAELYVDIILEAYGEEYSEFYGEITDDYKKQTVESMKEMLEWTYDDLTEVLGKNFDGRIVQVQMFEFLDLEEDGIYLKDAKISDRFVLIVVGADGEYQEVEGVAYTMGDRKGVWLQPD